MLVTARGNGPQSPHPSLSATFLDGFVLCALPLACLASFGWFTCLLWLMACPQALPPTTRSAQSCYQPPPPRLCASTRTRCSLACTCSACPSPGAHWTLPAPLVSTLLHSRRSWSLLSSRRAPVLPSCTPMSYPRRCVARHWSVDRVVWMLGLCLRRWRVVSGCRLLEFVCRACLPCWEACDPSALPHTRTSPPLSFPLPPLQAPVVSVDQQAVATAGVVQRWLLRAQVRSLALSGGQASLCVCVCDCAMHASRPRCRFPNRLVGSVAHGHTAT